MMHRAMDEQRLRDEAVRVYLRYAIEVVEGLGFCPWARRAREQGHVKPHVVLAAEPTCEEVLAEVDAVFASDQIDIGLIIFPRVSWDRMTFRRFVSQVRTGDAERHRPEQPPWAMADFHPHAEVDMTTPARLVSFVRRSPDPTIQVVRSAVLDAVHPQGSQGTFYAPRLLEPHEMPPMHATVPLHQRIAEVNHQTIASLGVERVSALLDDIRADRDRAYQQILALS